MVKITEDKLGTMAEYAEKMLHYGGRLMGCIEEMQGGYGQREAYGMRDTYGSHGTMNYRYPIDPVEDEMAMRGYGMREDYGERRGRDSRGRFVRM